MNGQDNRRKHQRYVLPSMYTRVDIRPLDSEQFKWSGHAYDISEGGMRFEMDNLIAPGTSVAVRLTLPGQDTLRFSQRRPVYAFANVVWVNEDDVEDNGPVRMACVFSRFVLPGDRERLMERLESGRYSVAA